MKKITFISFFLYFLLAGSNAQEIPFSKPTFMIRHTVVFKLKYPKGSSEESEFLIAASKLSTIPGVHNFESLRQTSKKNDFDYGLSMEFGTKEANDHYNNHPDHTKFILSYWTKYVDKFLEIDYQPIK